MSSGIYAIICKATGHAYVGSSTRIEARWTDHKSQLRRGIHHSTKLQEYWNAFEEEDFEHKTLEAIDASFLTQLEARESHWIQEYREKDLCLNTSDVTFNPMRNQASIDKMLATRGDSQSGANATSAKLTETEYLQIAHALATTTYSAEDLSDYFGLSPRSIRDLASQSKHKWIGERFPEQVDIMQRWRKNLRVFRATDSTPPEVDFGIDTSFMEQLGSFRRTYEFKTQASLQKRKLDDSVDALNEQKKRIEEQVANGKRELDAETRKKIESLARKITLKKKATDISERKIRADKVPFVVLVKSSGEEISFWNAEEVTAFGLDMKYITQLKAGKLLRYKGWRIKK